jgi:hypothetical protein
MLNKRKKWAINIYGMDSALLEIIEVIALENQKRIFTGSLYLMKKFLRSEKLTHLDVVEDLDNEVLIVKNDNKLICSIGINKFAPLILQNND